MSATSKPSQISLPGQTDVTEGPHDQTGMYLAHHAFRRDLSDFYGAVRRTPLHDRRAWVALLSRWTVFAEILHHHHRVEDDAYWPLMERRLRECSAEAELATLAAMEAEHAEIDPALQACLRGFVDMAARPSSSGRDALAIRIAAVRTVVARHLRHEETVALPILQRVVGTEDFAVLAKAALAAYPLRLIPFLAFWSMKGVSRDIETRAVAEAGMSYGVLLRLTRWRFVRRDRRAFRYA